MKIEGSGGGGSKTKAAPTPVEAANSLQSKAVARIFDLLGAGEIEGFVDENGDLADDPRKGMLFDGVRVMSADGALNFSGVYVAVRYGAPDQDPMLGIADGVPFETVKNEQLLSGDFHYATITDVAVDSVSVKITVPNLSSTDPTTGNMNGYSVSIGVEVKGNSDSIYTSVGTIDITGKCVAPYQRIFKVPITEMIQNGLLQEGDTPWTIRVVRLSSDSPSTYIQNSTYWTSYIETIEQKLIYPDCAYMGLKVDSEQFGTSIPTRAYHARLLKVQIPNNYNPTTRVYTGVWDGTFVTAWTNNPAWIYYYLLTNSLNGLGLSDDLIEDVTCKWDLYEISQYCDGMVDDGFGGTEPRFTCNCVLETQEEAYHVLNAFASVFRAMPFWGTGQAHIVQDRPRDPSRVATAANVEGGKFVYEGSSFKARYSVALVSWNDLNDQGKLAVEVYEDKEAILRYGWNSVDVTAFACTSRGQARRLGKWLLETGKNETDVCTFVGGFDYADCLPGEIVGIADPSTAEVRHGGRLVSAASNSVVLDSPFDFQIGYDYYLTIVQPYTRWSGITPYTVGELVLGGSTLYKCIVDHTNHEPPNGTYWEVATSVLASILITNPGIETATINLASSFSEVPLVHSVWVITETTEIELQYIRIVSNIELAPNRYQISGLLYDETKFARVEEGYDFETTPTPTVPIGMPDPPTNLQLSSFTYTEGVNHKFGLVCSWEHTTDPRVSHYEVQINEYDNETEYAEIGTSKTNTFIIKPVEPSAYLVRVRAVVFGGRSLWLTSGLYTVVDAPDPLPPPDSLTVVGGGTVFVGKDLEIEWTASDDVAITNAITKMSSKFKSYEVRIYKTTTTEILLRSETVLANRYSYTYEKNLEDNEGVPLRLVRIKIRVLDIYDQLSNTTTTADFSNTIPSMAGFAPILSSIYMGLRVNWSTWSTTDLDLCKFAVYLSDNEADVVDGAASALKQTVDINTKQLYFSDLLVGTDYYVKIVPYDEFGVGTASSIGSEQPSIIPIANLEVEFSSNIEMSDSDSNTDEILSKLYDNNKTSDGITYTVS